MPVSVAVARITALVHGLSMRRITQRSGPLGEFLEPSHVSRHTDRSVYVQLADILRADIQAGRYRPGERLPSEREMHAQHGVARGTVREALNRLKAEGLITVEHGKGAFVRETPQRLSVPLPLDGSSLPAALVQAISDEGRAAVVRPVGHTDEVAEQGGAQTAVIVFADGTPLGTWQARVETEAQTWPAGPEVGIHEAFPPTNSPAHRLEIRVRAATPIDRRLLQLDAGSAVIEVEQTYVSTAGPAMHLATYAAERVALVQE